MLVVNRLLDIIVLIDWFCGTNFLGLLYFALDLVYFCDLRIHILNILSILGLFFFIINQYFGLILIFLILVPFLISFLHRHVLFVHNAIALLLLCALLSPRSEFYLFLRILLIFLGLVTFILFLSLLLLNTLRTLA